MLHVVRQENYEGKIKTWLSHPVMYPSLPGELFPTLKVISKKVKPEVVVADDGLSVPVHFVSSSHFDRIVCMMEYRRRFSYDKLSLPHVVTFIGNLVMVVGSR